jgi:hypothetical protein
MIGEHNVLVMVGRGRLYEMMELLDPEQGFAVLTESGPAFFRRPAWLPGYFVAWSALGFWAGAGWVSEPSRALRFSAPPLRDPRQQCEDLCQSLMRTTGVACVPCYEWPRDRKSARKSRSRSRRMVSSATPLH